MKPTILTFLLLFLIFIGLVAGQNRDVEIQSNLAELLSTYEDWGFSGTVLVARGTKVIFEEGYGYANRETGESNTSDTRYDFASIAKTFTGAAVLALEADGVLSTDDRLEEYVGAFPDNRKAAATFHHVASHTAGLAHRSQSELAYGPDRDAYIESMKNAPFETPPGESYRYTNAGASFFAALVEEISGVRYEEFVHARFIDPLNLESARFIPETEYGEPGVALGYQDASKTPAPTIYDGDWGWGYTGATGITATVRDMYRWFETLHDGDILPPTQQRKLFDESEEEAYGWHTDRDEAGRLRIHKGGGLPAMQTQIRAYPEQDIVIVWAHNNMARNWRRALNEGITAVALEDPFGPVPGIDGSFIPGRRAVPKSGVYTTAEGTMLEVSTEEGTLTLGRNGLGATPGPLKAGRNNDWVLFSPDDVFWLRMSATPDDGLTATLGPGGRTLELTRTTRSMAAMLSAPDPEILSVARGYAKALLAGDADAVWRGTLYRPIQGAYSLEDWTRRTRFLGANVGVEARVIEEAWAYRNGSWRYWRSFESESGAQVVLRFGLTKDGQIAGFGMNPVQGAPEADEKRIIR